MAKSSSSSEPVIEHRFRSPCGLEIHICYGDITKVAAEGIVVPEGKSFRQPGFVGTTLIEMDSQFKILRDKLIIKKQASFKPWEVYTTKLGKRFTFAIHAIVPPCKDEHVIEWKIHMKGLYQRIFREADMKLISVAVPLLGSGKGKASREDAIELAMASAVQYKATAQLKTVMFVSNSKDIVVQMASRCDWECKGRQTDETTSLLEQRVRPLPPVPKLSGIKKLQVKSKTESFNYPRPLPPPPNTTPTPNKTNKKAGRITPESDEASRNQSLSSGVNTGKDSKFSVHGSAIESTGRNRDTSRDRGRGRRRDRGGQVTQGDVYERKPDTHSAKGAEGGEGDGNSEIVSSKSGTSKSMKKNRKKQNSNVLVRNNDNGKETNGNSPNDLSGSEHHTQCQADVDDDQRTSSIQQTKSETKENTENDGTQNKQNLIPEGKPALKDKETELKRVNEKSRAGGMNKSVSQKSDDHVNNEMYTVSKQLDLKTKHAVYGDGDDVQHRKTKTILTSDDQNGDDEERISNTDSWTNGRQGPEDEKRIHDSQNENQDNWQEDVFTVSNTRIHCPTSKEPYATKSGGAKVKKQQTADGTESRVTGRRKTTRSSRQKSHDEQYGYEDLAKGHSMSDTNASGYDDSYQTFDNSRSNGSADKKAPKSRKNREESSCEETKRKINKTKAESGSQTCPICLEEITDPKKLDKCGHVFCRECIDDSFKHFRCVCPSCNMVYGVLTGNQPDGNMDVDLCGDHLPGYEGYGTIIITYQFPNGFQKKEHSNPGHKYRGTTRRAYLPDCPEGNDVLRLLKTAFDRKLTFTIGRSTTTGQENVVTWNDIHHKTNMTGGPTRFGYPDPGYLSRVKEELASKGVTE